MQVFKKLVEFAEMIMKIYIIVYSQKCQNVCLFAQLFMIIHPVTQPYYAQLNHAKWHVLSEVVVFVEMELLIVDRSVILEVNQDAHQAAKLILYTNVLSLGKANPQFAPSFAEMGSCSRAKNAIMATRLAV